MSETTQRGLPAFGPSAFTAKAQAVWQRSPVGTIAIVAALALFASYTLVFWVTGRAGAPGAAAKSLFNVVPASLLAVPAYRLVKNIIMDKPLPLQGLYHPLVAVVFSIAWYLGIQVFYGMQDGWIATGLTPRSFSGIALTWQMFQGVTLYAVIACFAYAVGYWQLANRLRTERDAAIARTEQAIPSAPAKSRLLLRQDREIVPIDVNDIVRISGAGDKTEIVTRSTRIVTTSTMAELEKTLPDGFLRVHRSHLVALAAVLHAEPAGNGRLTLHLPGGESITASRAGARAFRETAM